MVTTSQAILTGYVDLVWEEIANVSTRRQGEDCVSRTLVHSIYDPGRVCIRGPIFVMSKQILIWQFSSEMGNIVTATFRIFHFMTVILGKT
jgi:hypothetical protein